MEEQSSILIQKKIIFVMTFLILFASYICANKDLYISQKVEPTVAQNNLLEVAEISEEDEIKELNPTYTALTEVYEDLVIPENANKSEPERIENSTIKTIPTVAKVNNTIASVPTEYEKVLPMSATAYCLCKKCCGKAETHPAYGYTASGYKITPGTNDKVIAVDTSIIPLGTKVYVEGLNGASSYGYAVAADTGSAIKNMKIDLYMDSHQEALNWGFKKVNVYIVED